MENSKKDERVETQLSKEELSFFKQKLTKRRDTILQALEIKEHTCNKDQEGKDEGDKASFASDSYLSNIVMKKQLKVLKSIEKSLKDIDKGTYGVCKLCDETINIERLKVKNFAKYCISCREIIEKELNEV